MCADASSNTADFDTSPAALDVTPSPGSMPAGPPRHTAEAAAAHILMQLEPVSLQHVHKAGTADIPLGGVTPEEGGRMTLQAAAAGKAVQHAAVQLSTGQSANKTGDSQHTANAAELHQAEHVDTHAAAPAGCSSLASLIPHNSTQVSQRSQVCCLSTMSRI